jgi:hypothetical protein
MTSLRVQLHRGRAILLDSRGNPVMEWFDKTYARAILNRECSVERWHEMFHKLAVEHGWLRFTAEGWIGSNHQA